MPSKIFLRAEQTSLGWDSVGLIAGVDEAGRGPLAGPVFAAAVILDARHPVKGLADSKKLSALKRERLFDEIRAKALCCSIAEASVQEIDELNILQATMLAMRRAVGGLRTSHHTTSHHITSHHITPHHITSHHITPCRITSYHITPHHIISHHIISHHTT